jgi:hypothetical protein
MKKQLLALALLTAGMANAQTWSEDFNAATTPGLPAGWLQNNVDGKTVASNLSTYNFGTNAWVTFNAATEFPAYGKVVASTSWYTPAGAANDWLITPSFTVPANAVLEWDGLAPDASFRDGYSVKISTTGTLTTDFSANLLTVAAENATWTNRSLSLNTYSTQTVRIAFVNTSNDMNRAFLDNIKVLVPAANDGNVVSITGLNRYSTAGNQTIAGVFKSKGLNPVTSATMNYKLNSGAVVTQTINFATAVNYGGTANYSFTAPASMPVGNNRVKVWVTHVNGVAETNLVNDSAAMNTIFTASQAPLRNALIEEFSSSTCVPCANLNVNFDPLLNSNNPNTGGRVNVIKNQVNWPSPGNDPSYNTHSAARVTYYGINAAPTALTNGTQEMNAHSQGEIDAAKAEPAYANITASLSVNAGVITGSASVIPYVSIPSNSPLVVHQVLLQSSYNFPAAVTTQKNYFHVMRKMFPSATGTALTPVDGTAMNVNFTHTVTLTGLVGTPAQNSYDFWDATNMVYEYVVFVQDKVSNDILQSGSAKINGPVGIVELKDNQKIGIYPNPAKDFAVVGISVEQSSNVAITIYDVTGKLVYSKAAVKVEAGQHEMKINTSDFATGTYNVIVNTDLGTLTDKLIVVQ